MNTENDNIIKDELENYFKTTVKKKKRNFLLIFISTLLLAVSIFIDKKTFSLLNLITIGILMINRSCKLSIIKSYDKGEKIEFIIGVLLVISSFITFLIKFM